METITFNFETIAALTAAAILGITIISSIIYYELTDKNNY
jgi:hypothetical protein